MNTSLFELFKIGIGPSSSHTVGPMRAALRFAQDLESSHLLQQTERLVAELYGSLALTGIGHGTGPAVLLGLLGEAPDRIDPSTVPVRLESIRSSGRLSVLGQHGVRFEASADLLFHRDRMYPEPTEPTHPNGLRFAAFDGSGKLLASEVFYSIGGGFILSGEEFAKRDLAGATPRSVPYPFRSASDLLAVAAANGLSIAELVLANEIALLTVPGIPRPAPRDPSAALDAATEVEQRILFLWDVMAASIARGIATEGTLPGGLNVRRRAGGLARRLAQMDTDGKPRDPLAPLDAVTLAAMAVNEENAAGGRVVTAPTNGAAGVVPAIAHYYLHHASPGLTDAERLAGLLRYFLTAAAIGILYKENASISGAEVGCQGEVGVACSMAAGGLVAALTPPPDASLPPEMRAAERLATNAGIEHAAEIAMEHNLGMTCDPIGGLVQIPCIERNGMGAVKAVNAARLAMNDPGSHKISLDQVIETMYRTGLDMQSRYKETSLAGLALNIIEC
ncbi:MAG: L-serine ammonia-lyase [Janthinobacterium lividum]